MKRIFAFLLTCTMALSLCTCAFAEETEATEDVGKLDKEIAEMQSKFEALSDKDKQALYDMSSEINTKRAELLEKYAELGVIDKEDVAQLVAMLDSMATQEKEKGMMPGGIIKHSPMKGRPKGGKDPKTSDTEPSD